MTSCRHTFCTIITTSHWPWALALHESLRRCEPDVHMAVLVVDATGPFESTVRQSANVRVLTLGKLTGTELGALIIRKYADQPDPLRWALKPVLMGYLLQEYEKVLYCDCDLFFFSDHAFLVGMLEDHDLLLTPHWRSRWAAVDRDNFDLLFREGLFNAGFVAASRSGLAPLDLWARNCLEVCEKNASTGQYDDQAHLNVLPVYFPGVHILRHRGCNVAAWNLVENRRVTQPGGEVLINGTDPIVFVHFTASMIRGVVSGRDPALRPHLLELNRTLQRYDPTCDLLRSVRTAPPRSASKQKRGIAASLRRAVRALSGHRREARTT